MIKIKLDTIDAIVHLKARKIMDGNVIIYDHPDIDIVVSPSSNKVLALSKNQYSDHIYATQSRLFDHLAKKGVVDPSKIRGGNIFGSLEGELLLPEEKQKDLIAPTQVAIYSIAKFLQSEAPLYRKYREYEEDMEKAITDPEDDDTTRLGKIPHEPRQGTTFTYPGHTAAYGLVGHYYEE